MFVSVNEFVWIIWEIVGIYVYGCEYRVYIVEIINRIIIFIGCWGVVCII